MAIAPVPESPAGYQFIHLDWSTRIRAKRQQSLLADHGKFLSTGWSARDILSEAARLPGHCHHVLQPAPPQIIYTGDGICEVLDVLKWIDKWIAHYEAKTGRKYRRDQPVMANGVISFPRLRMAEWENFRDACVNWLQSMYGDALRCVVEHQEENHPHLHFFVVPRYGINDKGNKFAEDFGTVHDGYAASRKIRRLHIEQFGKNATSMKTGRSYTKGAATRVAFTEAMCAWQDKFHEAVGSRFGLQRIGPRLKSVAYSEYKRRENLRFAMEERVAAEQLKKKAEALKEAQEETTRKTYEVLSANNKKAEEEIACRLFLADWSAALIENAAHETARRIEGAARANAAEESEHILRQAKIRAEAAVAKKVTIAEHQAQTITHAAEKYSDTVMDEATRKIALAKALSARVAAAIEWVNSHPEASHYKMTLENDLLKTLLEDETHLRLLAEERVMTWRQCYDDAKKDVIDALDYLAARGDRTFEERRSRYATDAIHRSVAR